MKTAVAPLFDRVLLRKREAAKGGPGELWLPDSVKPLVDEYEVIAVGPGKIHELTGAITKCTVKRGFLVIVPPGQGYEMMINDEKHLMVAEGQIVGVSGIAEWLAAELEAAGVATTA